MQEYTLSKEIRMGWCALFCLLHNSILNIANSFQRLVVIEIKRLISYIRAGFYTKEEVIKDLILDVYPIFVFGFFVIDGL